jgi:hypothetical protein
MGTSCWTVFHTVFHDFPIRLQHRDYIQHTAQPYLILLWSCLNKVTCHLIQLRVQSGGRVGLYFVPSFMTFHSLPPIPLFSYLSWPFAHIGTSFCRHTNVVWSVSFDSVLSIHSSPCTLEDTVILVTRCLKLSVRSFIFIYSAESHSMKLLWNSKVSVRFHFFIFINKTFHLHPWCTEVSSFRLWASLPPPQYLPWFIPTHPNSPPSRPNPCQATTDTTPPCSRTSCFRPQNSTTTAHLTRTLHTL